MPRTAPSTKEMGPLVGEAAAMQAGPEGVSVEVGETLEGMERRARGVNGKGGGAPRGEGIAGVRALNGAPLRLLASSANKGGAGGKGS